MGIFAASIPDRYPLPAIADFYARIAGSKFSLNLTFRRGIFKFPCALPTFPRPPLSPPFGLFEERIHRIEGKDIKNRRKGYVE